MLPTHWGTNPGSPHMAYRCSPIWACQHCPQYPEVQATRETTNRGTVMLVFAFLWLTLLPPPQTQLVPALLWAPSPCQAVFASVAKLAPAHRSGQATMSGIALSSLFPPSMLGPLATTQANRQHTEVHASNSVPSITSHTHQLGDKDPLGRIHRYERNSPGIT